MVMVLKERYQLRWDVSGTLAAVERPVGDGADDRLRCFLDNGSYDQIRRNGKKFYCMFNQFFNLLDLS